MYNKGKRMYWKEKEKCFERNGKLNKEKSYIEIGRY